MHGDQFGVCRPGSIEQAVSNEKHRGTMLLIDVSSHAVNKLGRERKVIVGLGHIQKSCPNEFDFHYHKECDYCKLACVCGKEIEIHLQSHVSFVYSIKER